MTAIRPTVLVLLGWAVAPGCGPSGSTADGGAAPDTAIDAAAPGDSDGSLPPQAGACVRPVGGPASGRHVLRFQSTSPPARVHLGRRYAGAGVGESALYALDGMWIEQRNSLSGVFACDAITEAAQLTYVNSHHNWRDRAEGTFGAIRYVVTLNYDVLGQGGQGWDITLTIVEVKTGATLGAAVKLTTTGGPVGLNNYPSSLPVYISELMPENTAGATGWKDPAGQLSPWLEIFNPSSGDVDLSGYFLSNDPMTPQRWSFPAGTLLARHQHLVIAMNDTPGAGPLTAPLPLSPTGGSVRLTHPTGVSAGERVYPALAANRSAVFSLTTDTFAASATASPGGGDL